MEKRAILPLAEYFKDIQDPRVDRCKKYRLLDIIIITLLATLCGAEGWEDIDRFALARKDQLKKFLLLENGIPGHDVYRRVFVRLIPQQIEECFMAWIRAVRSTIDKEIIAIDGKTLRGSLDRNKGIKAAHLVSTWASENRLVFAQVKVDDKSNEITAIPQVLSMIALQGCIVTIDAMGCQYEIANQIVEQKADYVFSLKGNQGTLHKDVQEYFANVDFDIPKEDTQVLITTDVDHGRIEIRKHAISSRVDWLTKRHAHWSTIKSIGVIEATREIGQKITRERRYYVSSLDANPELFARAARTHWGIENSLHYVLDVAFREDACRIKSGQAPENIAWIRKFAITLVRMDKDTQSSVKGKLKNLAWSEEYLERQLFSSDLADYDQPSTVKPVPYNYVL